MTWNDLVHLISLLSAILFGTLALIASEQVLSWGIFEGIFCIAFIVSAVLCWIWGYVRWGSGKYIFYDGAQCFYWDRIQLIIGGFWILFFLELFVSISLFRKPAEQPINKALGIGFTGYTLMAGIVLLVLMPPAPPRER